MKDYKINRQTGELPNNKRDALDWSKYFVIRCGSCSNFTGGLCGNCKALDGQPWKLCKEVCELHEPAPDYAGKIGVLDVGTRRYPKYIEVAA